MRGKLKVYSQRSSEERRLSKADQKPYSEYSRKILNGRSRKWQPTPDDDCSWKVARWIQSSEDKIAGNLSKEISDKLCDVSVGLGQKLKGNGKLTMIDTAVWYWVSVRWRSVCKPPRRALAILDRSRMLKIKIPKRAVMRWRSIFQTTRWSSLFGIYIW